jgi:KDO2-lipid IV(A) lauroyltransferase
LAYQIEAAAARAALWLLRGLGPVRASNACGVAARLIGPLLPVSRVAEVNLRLALPELDKAGRRRVVRGVWESLGRTAGEFPHLSLLGESAAGPGWEVAGIEHLQMLAARGGPAILFSGHIGNWEVVPIAAARRGLHSATMYRPAKNPVIDKIILQLRQAGVDPTGKQFAKGARGAREMLLHLRGGGCVGLLQDQKMNDGIEARFFGRPAMTASALAGVALRLQCPVVPTLAQRIGPARFLVTFEAPVALPDTGDRAADVVTLTQAVNDRLEAWIRAKPESWLWLHRRWPKDVYAGPKRE